MGVKAAKKLNQVCIVKCLYDDLVPISELKKAFHPKNRNQHSDEQIERLAKILNYQGARYPAKISNQSKSITSGHGRVLAAEKAGWTHYPVNYQDYENEAQEYADLTADNAIAAWSELDFSGINSDIGDIGPDFDVELLGIKNFEIEPADKIEPQCDEDEVPSTPKETYVKLGDIWKLGNHRLMCGDSTSIDAVEKLLNGEKVDMVYTDPPYGINEETDRAFASRTRKCKGNTFNKIIGDDSIDTALSVFSIVDSLSDTICYWGGNYYAHKLPPSSCWVVWDKRVEENQRDMNSDCELAYVKHPKKQSVRIFRHLWKGMIKGSENGQARIHPTQKPITLAEWCFEELNKESKTILDLFGGSGSTLIACEKTNRKCFMMELDPHYCQVIIERWEKYTGKKAVNLSETHIEKPKKKKNEKLRKVSATAES